MNWQKPDLHKFKDHRFESRLFLSRALMSLVVVFGLMGTLVWRFYHLQIIQHEEFSTQSDLNRIQVRPVAPNRGLIFDTHGKILALNAPSFTLSLVPERVKNHTEVLKRLEDIVSLTSQHLESFNKALKRRRRPYQPVPLKFNLSEDEIARLAVNEYRLEGVEVEAQLKREYPDGENYVHALGYVGRINERELSAFTKEQLEQYSGTDSIGKNGIERFYEAEVLGRPGFEHIETNAQGRVLKVLKREAPAPGKNLQLFLDAKLQKVAVEQLAGRRGSVVAIDVDTGGILAMVSMPSYDPNLFVTGISYANYDALRDSPHKPLFNRTIQAQYPAGSTLKPMLGLAGLQHRVVGYNSTVFDPGYYQIENDERLYREWKKGGHGSGVNLRKAIVESCDIYFYDLAFNLGVERLHNVGEFFGLGNVTGIDVPNERRGIWPSPKWKKSRRGRNWYTGDSLNMSIGQGFVLVTPLQLAVMTSTLANRGQLIQPRLVAKVGDEPTTLKLLNTIDISSSHWDYVFDAMQGVMHDHYRGTAWAVGNKASYKIAGKTGTAQVVGIAQDGEYESEKLSERNRDHALFVGFAPANDPKIAVAVIIENGESSSLSAAVAKAVMDEHILKPSSEEPREKLGFLTQSTSPSHENL